MDRAVYERAVRTAQTIISSYNPSIQVDGKWGRYSQRAYDEQPSVVKLIVDGALRIMGTSVSDIRDFRNAERTRGRGAVQNGTADVESALRAAAEEAGISLNLLRGFVRIESNFNPNAVNGSSRGLGQMQPAAWADARSINKDLPGYDKVFDPLQNARATAAYLKWTRRQVSRLTGLDNLSPEQSYLAHQQGAGGFAELYRVAERGATNGLGKNGAWLVTDRAMLGNPPQDGKGKTTDRTTFYRRWLAVAKAKIGPLTA